MILHKKGKVRANSPGAVDDDVWMVDLTTNLHFIVCRINRNSETGLVLETWFVSNLMAYTESFCSKGGGEEG